MTTRYFTHLVKYEMWSLHKFTLVPTGNSNIISNHSHVWVSIITSYLNRCFEYCPQFEDFLIHISNRTNADIQFIYLHSVYLAANAVRYRVWVHCCSVQADRSITTSWTAWFRISEVRRFRFWRYGIHSCTNPASVMWRHYARRFVRAVAMVSRVCSICLHVNTQMMVCLYCDVHFRKSGWRTDQTFQYDPWSQ